MSLRILVVALLFAGWLGSSLFAQSPLPKARKDRILVKFKAGEAPAGDERPSGRVLRRFDALGIEVIQLHGTKAVEEILTEYRADPRVVYAQPDYIRSKNVMPNDPKLADAELDPWHLVNDGRELGKASADIAAPAAWDLRTDASSVVVAVLDTGIRYTHEDLAANMWQNPGEAGGQEGVDDDNNGFIDDLYGADLVDNTGVPMDDEGHGTFVAGLIGAAGNNGKGVAGVCWNVKLMAVKVLGADGGGSDSDIIAGMEYARQHGAKIINASLGRGGSANLAMEDAIAMLNSSGVILVTAAGNDSFNNDFDLELSSYPSSSKHPNVVSVAATTRNDFPALFSNYGWRSVDIAAPGVEVPSTSSESDSSYDVASGTSISAPLVSGALALMTAHLPNLTPLQRIARLLDSAEPVAELSGKCVSGGRLNVRRALEGGSVAPVNDKFARALVMGSDIYFAGTMIARGASTQSEPNEPASFRYGSDTPRRTLWWTWTAPYSGNVVIEALKNREPGSFDRSIVTVYTGENLSSLSRVGANATNGTASGVNETLTFNAVFRQTYYICAETATRDTPVGFFGRYQIVPEGYSKYTILSVDSYGPGTVTPSKLLGETIHRRGKKITLKAKPAPGYILYGWLDPAVLDLDEAVLSREPVYTFSMPETGVMGVQALFVFNPFRDLKGHYNGLVTAEDGGSTAGFVSFDLAVSGAFTGSLRIGKDVYRFKGILRSDREFTTTVSRPGAPSLTLNFKLNRERRVTGTIEGGAGTYSVLAEAGDYSTRYNPALSAGRYTVLLPTANITTGQPAGAGYGLLTISPTGNVRFSGILGDDRKISQGANLFRTGHWPFYAVPYKNGGSIAGTVTFDESQPDSDLTGTVRWNKPPSARDRIYPGGFSNVEVQLTGSRFVPPVPGERIIALGSQANNAYLSVNGAGISNKNISVTVDSGNTVKAADGVEMVIYAKFGEFAAVLPENGRYYIIHGMISRKANRGAGYVVIGQETAAVTFGPTN